MNNIEISFFITFLSGFSTMIGCVFLFNKRINQNSIISKCLFFSSSVMLFTSIFDLIPSSFNYLNKIYLFVPSMAIVAVYVLFGAILVYVIDRKNNNNDNLYKIGFISMITIVLHNIPEGIITYITSSKDISLGLSLAFSIAIHNIPEGIAISVPIFYSSNNKKKAIIYTFLAALGEPFGALISYLFLYSINNYLFAIILSFTSGIMIYLSIFELLKEGLKYNKRDFILCYILGILIMIIAKIVI